MATGIIESIDSNDTTKGTVREDESNQVYNFSDPNFPNTGLKVGDPCMYDIDYSLRFPVASNLMAYQPSEREITTPVTGDQTVNPGETWYVRNGGTINGNVNVINGKLIIGRNGSVTGNITLGNQANLVSRNGGMINGNVNVNTGCTVKVKEGGMINGTVIVNNANRLIIGDTDGPGKIMGSLSISRVRKVEITAESSINCR